MVQPQANPYAPPLADPSGHRDPKGKVFWLEGNKLIARRDAVLPDICIWNGEAARATERRHLSWAPSWFAIFVLSPLIYIIVYLLGRKRAYLTFALSEAARERAKQARMIAILGFFGGVAVAIVGANAAPPEIAPVFVMLGMLEALIALIVGSVRSRTVSVVRIDKDHVHLKLPPAALAAFSRLRSS